MSKIETFFNLPSNHVNKDGGKREKRTKQGLQPMMQHEDSLLTSLPRQDTAFRDTQREGAPKHREESLF